MIDTTITREHIARETGKAYLVRVPGRNHEVWLPKSQVKWMTTGCFAESIHVPAWLYRQTF